MYVTIGWNAFEGAGAIIAGIAAGSVALTAFGLDSSVEVFVSAVAAWQLRAETDRRDRAALVVIGICFVLVALYVGAESVLHLVAGARPEGSPVGIALTASAAVIMTFLGLAKGRIGAKLANEVLSAEARFSLVDAGLSATVLTGLVLTATLGWWWADPVVALGLALLALKEGVEGVRPRPR